jgi:hypothetical protein
VLEGEYKGKVCKHCRCDHHSDSCWVLEKNKGKRPKWFDPAKVKKKDGEPQERSGRPEVSTVAVGSGMELLLTAMHFPRTIGLLDDPNIWIADTAATCDLTSRFCGWCQCKDS